jgi:hypothetical protein
VSGSPCQLSTWKHLLATQLAAALKEPKEHRSGWGKACNSNSNNSNRSSKKHRQDWLQESSQQWHENVGRINSSTHQG